MSYQETQIQNFIINKLSKAKYEELLQNNRIQDNELYLVKEDEMDANGDPIHNVGTPELSSDAVNKDYVDNNFVLNTEIIKSIEQTILPISGTANRASPVYGGTIDFSKLTYNYPIKSINSMIVKSSTTSGAFASNECYLKVFQSNIDPITNSVSDYTFLGVSENKQANTQNTVMTFSFNSLIVDETKPLLVIFSTTKTNDFNNLVGCRVELVNENPNTFPNIGYITAVSNGNLTIAQAQSLDLTIVANKDIYEIGNQGFYTVEGVNKKAELVESKIPTNYVTTDTEQTITGRKTIIGPTKFNLNNGSDNGISIKASQLANATDVFKEYYQNESGDTVRRSMVIETPSGNGTDLVLKQGNNDRRLVLSVPHGPHESNNGIHLTTGGAGIYLNAGTGSINVNSNIDLKSSDGNNGYNILGVRKPEGPYQATNKKYVDDQVETVSSKVDTLSSKVDNVSAKLEGFTTITGALVNEVKHANIPGVDESIIITGIAYNGLIYILSTRSGGMYKSTDAINWTKIDLSLTEDGETLNYNFSVVNAIRYINGLFFISVGNLRRQLDDGTYKAHPYHGIMYSTDGTNWNWTPAKYLVEDYPANSEGNRWRRIIYDISFDGTNYMIGTDRWDWNTGLYIGEVSWFDSVDGELHTLDLGNNYGVFSVSYGDYNNKYVLGTRNGILTLDELAEDAEYTEITELLGKSIRHINYHNGRYVAAEYGTDPGGIWISNDGTEWTLISSFDGGTHVQAWSLRPIYVAGGIWAFLSLSHTGSGIYAVYSTLDFETFVKSEIELSIDTYSDLVYINGKFLATGKGEVKYVDISEAQATISDIHTVVSKYTTRVNEDSFASKTTLEEALNKISVLETNIDNKIYISDTENGERFTDLSVIKLTEDDYNTLVYTGQIDKDALYVVENENLNAYGKTINNVGTPELSSDAANKDYVDTLVNSTSSSGGGVDWSNAIRTTVPNPGAGKPASYTIPEDGNYSVQANCVACQSDVWSIYIGDTQVFNLFACGGTSSSSTPVCVTTPSMSLKKDQVVTLRTVSGNYSKNGAGNNYSLINSFTIIHA
jgi:hypothetical protein